MSTTANVASTTHHAAHATGGADAITPASIGAIALGEGSGFTFFDTTKTGNFTAAAYTGYHIDTTSNAVQATLESEPADGTQNFFEIHAFTSGHNFTVVAGSGDTLERSITRSLGVGQSVLVQYDLSSRVWYEVADLTPLSLLPSLNGFTMAGVINMNSNKITNLEDGSTTGDAVAWDQLAAFCYSGELPTSAAWTGAIVVTVWNGSAWQDMAGNVVTLRSELTSSSEVVVLALLGTTAPAFLDDDYDIWLKDNS